MKVVVCGAGVVGVTSAWFLAEAGHEVTVVDRQPGAALETSFANGGQISVSHAEPWANPSTPFNALKWLGREDAPLIMRLGRWDPALWAWGLRFLANCTATRARANTEKVMRLALYSRACLGVLRQTCGLEYDQQTKGILHIYRDARTFAHATRQAALMTALGLPREVKTAAECVGLEPALSAVGPELAGGLYTPQDESGDAHKFTAALAALAAARGVTFRFNTAIRALTTERGQVSGVVTDAGVLTADAYVLALGSYSPLLAASLGLRLPVYPAKGYSATVAVTTPAAAPTVSVTDDEHKLVYSRLGDRLRIAGTAELGGYDTTLPRVRTQAVVTQARALFPQAGDYDTAELWCGLRPMTPDYAPILGATRWPNLYLNTGHGTLGWTMACGSGRVLADVVSGRSPDIALDGLGLYGR